MNDREGQDKEDSSHAMGVGILSPVLNVLNELLDQGLLDEYAIAGGVAALYYAEPVLTYDFDVVCAFPKGDVIVDPTPIFAYLKRKGYVFGEEDRVNVEGIPVQFIPASPGLVEEAVQHARSVTISGVKTRILTVEYLIAIMLHLYRPKDRAKLGILLSSVETFVDQRVLEAILEKYGLIDRWRGINETRSRP